jgi:nitroimidazol reductase NimA-like FMN-containing flavoprotein (pyridoxamine 5'-phosphate oxidase superfamily)
MKNITQDKAQWVEAILSAGRELVLASIRPDGTPHGSTLSYANEGLKIYCAISLDSQKAHDIRHDAHVAYVMNGPYKLWTDIRGVSVDARASMLNQSDELQLASSLLLRKYPEFSKVISDTRVLPWPGVLFISLQASVISLLDYAQGFGHMEQYAVPFPAAI